MGARWRWVVWYFGVQPICAWAIARTIDPAAWVVAPYLLVVPPLVFSFALRWAYLRTKARLVSEETGSIEDYDIAKRLAELSGVRIRDVAFCHYSNEGTGFRAWIDIDKLVVYGKDWEKQPIPVKEFAIARAMAARTLARLPEEAPLAVLRTAAGLTVLVLTSLNVWFIAWTYVVLIAYIAARGKEILLRRDSKQDCEALRLTRKLGPAVTWVAENATESKDRIEKRLEALRVCHDKLIARA